jgi:hypothetical protein
LVHKPLAKLILLILNFIVFFSPLLSFSQEQSVNDYFYWIRYYNQFKINEKKIWHNEIDTRHYWASNRHQQFIMHSHLHFLLPKSWELTAGFSYSVVNRALESMPKNYSKEFRPFQEIIKRQKIKGKAELNYRIRLDNRVLENVETGKYRYILRPRFRIQFSQVLFPQKPSLKSTFKCSDEVFTQFGEKLNIYDHNRISFYLEKSLVKSLSLELGYIYLNQKDASGLKTNRNISRISLIHRINRK